MRQAEVERNTKETRIKLSLDIDGKGMSEVSTGIGFFDHMLTALARHSGFDIRLVCDGDLEVDGHHTVEDVGIVLGQALLKALGDKLGIQRYGSSRAPMDEALISVDLDISGRPFIVYNVDHRFPMIGDFDVSLAEEFFRAFAFNAGITLHINCIYGRNDHHIVEASFKALAQALRKACSIDQRFADVLPSTKGML